ncbi:conserved Plasmodium protein, unknown function [Plasmodium relictum]|uniref:Uncharacterized protein n=1 Tax=Plasmodium relictum TaxID=85471 RepID=A0A1J1H0N4_PLARL|nr:conserved Plasmodium protein, unknown function [Plasmodium relictum]CRG98527.1 conserved Plasmodium protein, unknown function [Plasmodium relictum]
MERKPNKKEKKRKEKEKETSYISDTVTLCGTLIRDSMIVASEIIQNNYYPIKESIINAYDSYFCECSQQTSVNGNVPFFTIKSDTF